VAQETVTVKFKVMEDGSLQAIGKNAKKAAAGMDQASKATAGHNKQQKGVAGLTSNSTKGFSKMTTGITGGLVPAYATLAANVFALSAAFGLLSRNDAIAKLNEGLQYTGNSAGKNLGMVADKLKEITDNAISAEAAMRATAVGVSAGFSESQLENLTRVAKGASLALGRDMGDAMDRLIRGAAKLEPEILDELGIMVRLDDATKAYADSVGKAVGELTQFERRMAFTNAVIADGTSKFQDIAAELDASPYSQLSAAFSDFTKVGIEFLNKFLRPVIAFLAGNMVALSAVILALGASISSTLIGSISSMALASSAAATQTSNIATASAATIKVIPGAAKGFNTLAAAVDREDAALRKMFISLRLSSNLMSKTNPMLKQTIATRGMLANTIHLNAMAVTKEAAAASISMIQTHGLSAAWANHGIVLTKNTADVLFATTGQDFYTQAIIRTRGALFALSSTAKMAGASLLVAMPYIMGAMMALAILGPMVSSLFTEKENALSKQLETNTTRLKGFAKVVAQYTRTIKKAEDAADTWHRTLKPLAGLVSQIQTAMQDTSISAETTRILAYSAAVKEATRTSNLAALTRRNPVAGRGSSGAVYRAKTGNDARAAAKDVTANEELSQEQIDTIAEESRKMVAGVISATTQMIEGLQAEKRQLEDGSAAALRKGDALAVLVNAQVKSEAILETLTGQTTANMAANDAAEESVTKLAESLVVGLKAYENFNDIISKATVLTATPTFGEFAKEIDNVTNALNSLNAIDSTTALGKDAQEKEGLEFLAKYGRELQEVKKKGATAYTYLQPEFQSRMQTAKEAVEAFKLELEDINKRAKDLAISQAHFESFSEIFQDTSTVRAQMAVTLGKVALDLALDTFETTVKGGEAEHAAKLAIIQLERDYIDLIKERFNVLADNAKDSGMGAAASAAIRGQGSITAAEEATYKDTKDADGNVTTAADNKVDALSTARLEASKESLRGVATDLAAIGPEGAFMSSVIEGAMNMQLAFSTAFEIMGDKSLDMSTRVQAGLGALGSMISSLSAMSKASSDDKVRGIDDEIAAEKKRDGTSAASTAKMKSLESKKLAVQKKAFETNKKMKMAQTVISTAMGAMAAYSSAMESIPAPFNVPVAVAMAGMVAAMGAKQLSMIAATSFSGGGSAGGASAPAAISVGSRANTVDLGKGNNAGGELAYARGESGTGTGMTDFKPTGAFSGYKGRAAGGYIVGEQGPEVFMPDVPGEIISSGQGGGSTNISFNIQAVDAMGVEDVLIQQKGHIIKMIREAANEHGEFFLENVREEAYER